MADDLTNVTENSTPALICELFRIFYVPTGRHWPMPEAESEQIEQCTLFESEEMQRVLLSYREKLSDLELMKYYKAVSAKISLQYLLASECCIPYLEAEHLEYFLKEKELSWSAVGAIIFGILRLAVVRVESCRSDVCLLKVIETLSDFFMEERRLTELVRLGGWEAFCTSLKGEGESKMDIMPYFHNFDAQWRKKLPTVSLV